MARCIVLITTYQTPHLEDLINFDKLQPGYDEYVFVNMVPHLPFRNDLTPRSTVSLRMILSRIFWNFFVKQTALWASGVKKKFWKFRKSDVQSTDPKYLLSEDEAYRIAQSFVVNEVRNSSFNVADPLRVPLTHLQIFLEKFICYMYSALAITSDDQLVIFNGRLPTEAMSIALMEKYVPDAKWAFIEVNQFVNKAVIRHKPIHDLASYDLEIMDYAESKTFDQLRQITDEIITSQQRNAKQEQMFQKQKTNLITFFTSSIDEYLFYYENPVNQVWLIGEFKKLCAELDVQFVVRVHPNTIAKSKETANYWRLIKKQHPKIIINFDERVSSYELIEKSLFTISIGSSVAAQSVLLNVPHLLIGTQSYYHHIPGFVKTEAEDAVKTARRLITDPEFYALQKAELSKPETRHLVASSLQFERAYGYERSYRLWGKTFNVLSDSSYNFKIKFQTYDDTALSYTDDDKWCLDFINVVNEIRNANVTARASVYVPVLKLRDGRFTKFGRDLSQWELARYAKALAPYANDVDVINMSVSEGNIYFVHKDMMNGCQPMEKPLGLADFAICPLMTEKQNKQSGNDKRYRHPDHVVLTALRYHKVKSSLSQRVLVTDFLSSPSIMAQMRFAHIQTIL